MKPKAQDLAHMLSLVMAAVETPGDLTEQEIADVFFDAGNMLAAWETDEPAH